MKNILIAVFLTIGLIGCSTTPHEVINPVLPKGLLDCKVYETPYGTIVRCPNSATSIQYDENHGKQTVSVSNMTIEDTITITVPTEKKYVLTK